MKHIILLLFIIISIISAKDLVLIQALWRHGDRSPSGSYPNDPYPESFWPVPWSELSPLGMDQHFRQGLKIKQRYVEQFRFLNSTYHKSEVSARSTDVDRCLASAYSNLAGLYSDSTTSYPTNNSMWPKNWTPIPVHTVPLENDNLLNPDFACAKLEAEEAKLGTNVKFLEYAASKAPLLLKVSEDSGIKVTDIRDLKDLFDSLKIEKYHNLTLPSWVTDDLYSELEDVVNTVWDLLGGQSKIDIPENTELIKLKGGNLLKTIIGNMENSRDIVKNNGVNQRKYNIFSAHDTTVAAFLRTLGAKDGVLGNGEPIFASIVMVELWKDINSNFFVQVIYSDDAESQFRTITKYVSGCNKESYCPLDTFISRSDKYMPKNIDTECL
uniref:Lysosomal acid phosphatase n=1 Tax=Strongyloides venezuelensis TaxID=75913 RepID=A0A0K0FLE0_STRVS